MTTPLDPSVAYTVKTVPVHVEDQPIGTRTSGISVISGSSSNGAATVANTVYTFAFSATVYHVMLQNNSSQQINFDFISNASGGSPVLAPAQTIFLDVALDNLYLLTSAATNVNGTTAGNIVIRGWT